MKKIRITTSTIHDGDMRKKEAKNLEKFLRKIHLTQKDIVTMHQVHSATVQHVSGKDRGKMIQKCDALITRDKDVALGVRTADCLPVVFADSEKGITAVAHAGYKGIVQGIIENTLDEMEVLGAKREGISVYIGPGIGDCCYDVDNSRLRLFEKIFPMDNTVRVAGEKKYISLKRIVKNDLAQNGIQQENIHISDVCTKCSKDHFSFRRNNKITGLNITVTQASA